MKTRSKIRTQKGIPGQQRKRVGSAVTQQIERRLKQEMRIWGVSRSFVIANALAFTFHITLEDDYKRPILVKGSKRA